MAEVTLKRLREYYYTKIDDTDLGTLDEVNRLVDLVGLHRKYRKDINDRGITGSYRNGKESYEKENPSTKAIQTLQSEITKLKKSINWKLPENTKPLDEINDEDLI